MQRKEKGEWYPRLLKWGSSFLALLVAITGGCAIYYYHMAKSLKSGTEYAYQRAFSQLYADVEQLRGGLAKAMVTGDKEEMLRLSEDVYRMADGAKQNLGYLPISEDALDLTETFLAQVGNYTSFLAHRHLDGSPVSPEEGSTLRNLYEYAGKMEAELSELSGKLERGEILLWDGGSRRTPTATLSESYGKMEEAFAGYPSLSYDAPFSAHLLNPTPATHREEREVTVREAMTLAKKMIGNRAASLSYEGEGGGTIPAYVFSGDAGDRKIFVKITKSGGHLLWFLDSRLVQEEHMKPAEAVEKGKDWVRQLGFGETEPSFFDVAANTVTVWLTPVENGVLLYPDALLVRVALDNGEVVGVEATDYRMNHRERDLAAASIGIEESKRSITPNAALSGGQTVLFVPQSGRETLAYEWKATLGEDTFLVYVSAENGAVEAVKELTEDEKRRMVDSWGN